MEEEGVLEDGVCRLALNEINLLAFRQLVKMERL